jgi:hypothetical protein
VAARFNGPPSEPLVRVAQVDCVAQARLCNEFGVRGYPTLRFGHPADFTHGSHGADVESQPREADVLLGWLNNKLGQCVWGGRCLLPCVLFSLSPSVRHAGSGRGRCQLQVELTRSLEL